MERAVDRTLGTTALEAVVHLLLQKNRLPELFTIVDFCLQSDSVLKNDRLQQVCNIAIESIRSTTSTSNTEKIIIQRLLVKQLFVYIIQKKLEKLCGKLQTKSLLFCKKQQDFRTTEEVSITRILKNHEKLFYDCIAGYNNKDEKVLKEVQDILWLMKAFLSQKSLIKSTPSYSASGSSYTSDNIFIVRLLMDVLYTKQIQTNDDKNGPEITRTKTDIQQQSSSFCLFFHQLLTMSSNDEKDNTKQVKLANAFWGLSDNEINLPAVLTDVVDPTVPKMIRTFVLYVWSLWIHEKSSIVLEYIRQSAGRQLNPEPKNSATRTRRLGRVCVSLSMELHSYTLVVPNKKEEISLLQMELLENAVLWHPELTSHVLGSFFSVFPLHSKVFKRFSKLKRSIGMHLHLSVTDDEARRTLSSTCTELKRKTKQMVDKMVEKCIFSSCSDGLQLHVVRAGGGGVGEGGKEGTDENVHVQDEQLGIYLSTCCSNYNFRRLCFQLFTKKGEYSLRPATAARKNTSSNFLSDQVGRKEIQKLLQKQRNELDKKIQDLRFDLQQQKQQNQQNQQSIPVNKTKAFVSNTCINSIDSSEKNNPTTFVKDVAELARQMYEEDHKTDISRKEIINTSKKTDNTSKSPQNFVLKLFQLNKKKSNHEKNLEGFFQSFDEKEPTKEDSPTKLLSDRPNVETQNKCSSNTKALVTPLRYTEIENVDLNSAKLKLLKTRSRVRNQAISLIDKDFIAPPTPDYKESKGYKRVLSELTQEAVIRAVDATTQACILKNTSAQTDAIQPDQIDIKTESSDAITALQNSEASQIVVSPSISTHQKLPEKQEQISRSPQCEKNEPKECIVSGVQCSLDLNDRAERQRRRIQQRLSSFLDFSLTCTSINRCPTASSKNYLKIVSVPFDTDNEKQLMEVDAVDGSVRPTPRPRFSLQLDIPSTCEQPLKNEIDPTSQPEAVSIQEQWQVYGDTIVLGTLSDSETVELKGSLKRLEETLTNPNPPVVDTTTIDLFRFGLNQGAVREESVPEGTRNRTILNDMKEMKKRLEILEKCADEIDQDFDESHRKIQLAEAQHQELVHQSRSKRIMKTLDFLQEQVEEDLASSNHRAMKEDQKDLTRSDTITTNSTGNEGNAVKAGILSQKASKDAMKARYSKKIVNEISFVYDNSIFYCIRKLVEQIEAFVRK
jgi:hypothetical protein